MDAVQDEAAAEAAADVPDPVLYNIHLWFTPVLVALGTVGNCLSVVVFFGTKLKKLSSSYYLSALAVSDTCCLIALAAPWLSLIDIPVFSRNGVCQFIVYIKYVCSFLSVWFVVAFTVERFVAVSYPLQRPSVCTVARARAVLATLSVLGLATYSPYLLMSAPVEQPAQGPAPPNSTVRVCLLLEQWRDLANLLNYADLALTLVLPVVIIVTLNASIARTVWSLARARRNLAPHAPLGLNGPPQQLNGSTRGRRGPRRTVHHRASSSTSQTKVTEMLLVVSTVFVALNLPSYVMRVWVFLDETLHDDMQMIILQNYFNILFDINFGINFVLYCVSGQNFRRALLGMCGVHRRTDNTLMTVVSECRHSGSLCRNRTVTIHSWRDARDARDGAGRERDRERGDPPGPDSPLQPRPDSQPDFRDDGSIGHELLPLSKIESDWNGYSLDVDKTHL